MNKIFIMLKTLFEIFYQNRRDNVYLISDIARKTAKFFDAKKSNIPCVNYKWINESIEKVNIFNLNFNNTKIIFVLQSEVQDWERYALVFPEKETKLNNNKIDGDEEDQ